jgi:hypothetical protein
MTSKPLNPDGFRGFLLLAPPLFVKIRSIHLLPFPTVKAQSGSTGS